MKKLNIRIVAFAFLLTASLFSYSYLTCVSDAENNLESNTLYAPTPEATEEEKDIYMPDVEMVNKLIEAGKRLSTFAF